LPRCQSKGETCFIHWFPYAAAERSDCRCEEGGCDRRIEARAVIGRPGARPAQRTADCRRGWRHEAARNPTSRRARSRRESDRRAPILEARRIESETAQTEAT